MPIRVLTHKKFPRFQRIIFEDLWSYRSKLWFGYLPWPRTVTYFFLCVKKNHLTSVPIGLLTQKKYFSHIKSYRKIFDRTGANFDLDTSRSRDCNWKTILCKKTWLEFCSHKTFDKNLNFSLRSNHMGRSLIVPNFFLICTAKCARTCNWKKKCV